jgi:hypothetical protein
MDLLLGGATSSIRVISILTAIAIAAVVRFEFGTDWYIWFPLGVVGYLLVRYIGWAVLECMGMYTETRPMSQDFQRLAELRDYSISLGSSAAYCAIGGSRHTTF